MTLPKAYMNEIRDITGYWGTYLPSDRLLPGMVGRIENGLFTKEGMLSDYPGFDPAVHDKDKPQPSRNRVNIWQSKNVTAASAQADASVPGVPANGEVRFKFNKANNAVMICKEVRAQSFMNLGRVKALLFDLLKAEKWDPALCLITDVRLVEAAWICFATGSDQEAVINASATIGLAAAPIDALKEAAAQGTLEASWNKNKSAGYSTEVTDGGTPLFLALRFKRSIPVIGSYDLKFLKGDSQYFEEPDFGEKGGEPQEQ